MQQQEARPEHAARRHSARYHTLAKMAIPHQSLTQVGRYDYAGDGITACD